MRYGMRGAYQEAADTSSAHSAQLGGSQAASLRHFCDWTVCCNAYKPRNTLAELRMILLFQISPDQCPIDKYEIRYGTRGAHQEAAARRGAAQLGRSQAASS